MSVRAAVPAGAAALVREVVPAEVSVVEIPPADSPDLRDRLAGVEYLVLDHERSDLLPLLGLLPALRHVQLLIVGTEWVEPYLPAGVRLGRPVGARDNAVAEWVGSALLGTASGLLAAVSRQRDARWVRTPSRELRGQRVVVVGQGSTGRATAALLALLGVTVVPVAAHARPGVQGAGALPGLLADADAVVLLVPATPATEGMVDAAMLARMPDGCVLVNASRGTVVDTDALVAELVSGRLRAVLDVTDPEPLPPGHPLWHLPGCALSPHVAGATYEARARSLQHAADHLAGYARQSAVVAAEPS
jgi:phosphoglycerate dehydrogenase-like enzyme